MSSRINLKLNISRDPDILILYLIIFQAFLSNFLYLADTINKVISILVLLRLAFLIVCSRYARKNVLICTGVLLCWILIMLINAALLNSYDYFQANFNAVFYTISVCVFMVYLILEKKDALVNFFLRGFKLINFYAIINCIIILIQASGNYFLIDISRTTNSFYVDHVTGLQGLDSTNCLVLIWTFIIIYNFAYAERSKEPQKRRIRIYNILLLVVTIYVSSLNDSKFYYFFILFILVIYYIMKSYWQKRLTNRLFGILALGIICLFLLNTFGEYILSLFGDAGASIMSTIDSVTNVDLSNTSNNTERVSILIYVYNNGNFWGFGKGIGEYSFYSSETAFGLGKGQTGGYWGTANLGPFLYAFGVYVTAGLTLMMACLFSKALASDEKVEVIPFITSALMLLMMLFYNKIFTHQRLMIDFCLIIIALVISKDTIICEGKSVSSDE